MKFMQWAKAHAAAIVALSAALGASVHGFGIADPAIITAIVNVGLVVALVDRVVQAFVSGATGDDHFHGGRS